MALVSIFKYSTSSHVSFQKSVRFYKKLKALLVRIRLELSSQDSTIYFVVERPYDKKRRDTFWDFYQVV